MPLKQDPLPQQAADLAVLYALNLVRGGDVVTWADCLVASLDSPGSDLIDLSLAGNDLGGIHRLLDELAQGADRDLAFRRALIEVHDRLRDGAVELGWVLHILYDNCVLPDHVVPDNPLRHFVSLVPDNVRHFASWAVDEYDLIQDGIKDGNIEQLHSDTLTLLNELGRRA
jgi:hypothetical protein